MGEFTQYILEAQDDNQLRQILDRARESGNVQFAEEERVERKLGEQVDVVHRMSPGELPEAASLRYINFANVEQFNGQGAVVMGSDTGCGNAVKEMYAARFIDGRNFSDNGDMSDTTDRDGHGSTSGYMATPPAARYMPLKVLGDDGSGSSAGIVKSFYFAGQYAEQNPYTPIIMNCSWGSAVTNRYYAPYKEALDFVTSRGIIVVFAAGNENTYGLGSPANFSRVNEKVLSVIAFDKSTDQRASFSNYHEDGTLSGPGVRELGVDQNGNLGLHNGTSFAAPWTTFSIAALSTVSRGAPLEKVSATIKLCGRDSAEPKAEEGGGVLDVATTSWKVLPKPEEPYHPELPKVTALGLYKNWNLWREKEVVLYGPGENLKTTQGKGRYVPRALDTNS